MQHRLTETQEKITELLPAWESFRQHGVNPPAKGGMAETVTLT